jgi:hypothetical protein
MKHRPIWDIYGFTHWYKICSNVNGKSVKTNFIKNTKLPKKNFVASVRKRTIPTERPPSVSEVSANFFADRGCHVVTVTNPYGRILAFLDRSRYYFFQVALQLYSRDWVDPVLKLPTNNYIYKEILNITWQHYPFIHYQVNIPLLCRTTNFLNFIPCECFYLSSRHYHLQ